MAARVWFTADNTSADVDRTILNRAARHLQDSRHDALDRAALMAIRCAYKPGMSAADIVAAVEAAEEYH